MPLLRVTWKPLCWAIGFLFAVVPLLRFGSAAADCAETSQFAVDFA